MYVVQDATRFIVRVAVICLLLGFIAGVWVMSDTASGSAATKVVSSTQEGTYPQQEPGPSSVLSPGAG